MEQVPGRNTHVRTVTTSSKLRGVNAAFSTLALPLARAAIDRAGELRLDADKLSELWRTAAIVHFSSGKFHCTSSTSTTNSLTRFTSTEIDSRLATDDFTTGERFFLGFDSGTAYFAWCSEDIVSTDVKADFKSLREIGDDLTDADMGLAVHTQALANWHHTHQFCSRCGATTTSAQGGSLRKCDVDGAEHYPRTDPAIIVLVKDKGDNILLGRQKVWPEHRFSNFAGFVEPGESFENCVAREVEEEAGVDISDVIYLGSQPWPFPASIMIAFHAITSNPEAARPDGQEIEEVRW
ncbi:MAG: NAD(+) diphosphatase, partial [Actinobacteria bacterium]|nr:NAD(+) diphosphatase [Actinomycetota bacterium]